MYQIINRETDKEKGIADGSDQGKYDHNTFCNPFNENTTQYSDFELRGYHKNTWIGNNKINKDNSGITTATNSTTCSSLSNITISSILSHSFCPRCAYISFKERRYEQTLQSIEGQIRHFVVEQFLAKEFEFTQQLKEYGAISSNTCLNFLSELEQNTKDRFAFKYDNLGGDFEALWNSADWFLKKRFSNLVITSGSHSPPKREFETLLFSSELGLTGRLDVLEERTVPVEIKTGKAPIKGYYLSHAIQVTLYALIIENKYHIDVDTGYIYYYSIDNTRVVNIDYNLRREAIRQRNLAWTTFQKNEVPEGKCWKCRGQKAAAATALYIKDKNGNEGYYCYNNNNPSSNNQESRAIAAIAKGIEKIYKDGT
jgi:CRISPR/Cas system-associated exonuclease Cas4 (RecB family)